MVSRGKAVPSKEGCLKEATVLRASEMQIVRTDPAKGQEVFRWQSLRTRAHPVGLRIRSTMVSADGSVARWDRCDC